MATTDTPINYEARAAVCMELGLPLDSTCVEVLQHVMTTSGHTCRWIDMLKLAQIMGGDLQLYVTNDDEVDPHPV